MPSNYTNESLRSKIMCSIQENQDLDLKLLPSSEEWFSEFKNIWKSTKFKTAKEHSTLKDMLYHHLEGHVNPYEEIVRLTYNSPDFNCAKANSMAFTIIKDFKEWTIATRKSKNLLSSDVKMFAFNVIRRQKRFELLQLVATVYEMEAESEIFLDIIKQSIREKRYQEACDYSTIFQVGNNFDIHEFLVPLIFQNAKIIFSMERFLRDNFKHQSDLVSFMDSMLEKRANFKPALKEYAEKYVIPDVKWDNLTETSWEKMMDGLVKNFKLSDDITPCLNRKKKEKYLRYVLKLKYEKSMDYEIWEGKVIGAVKSDDQLRKKLVRDLVFKHKDSSEALKWARHFDVPKKYWPESVKYLDGNPSNIKQEESVHKVDDSNFHKLSVSINAINDVDGFKSFLDQLQNVDLVGVDCEWNSGSSGREKSKLAIIQIATRERAYILNATMLINETDLWQELTSSLFNNLNILKLGFDFKSDRSIKLPPGLSFNESVRFLDLQSLWKKINGDSKIALPHKAPNDWPSLTNLVHSCLGKPLNKSCSLSNWEIWPLYQQQLNYAALDAFCLIEVYDILQMCCEEVNFPFGEACEGVMYVPKDHQGQSKLKKNVNSQ